jgi:hypothetical protein
MASILSVWPRVDFDDVECVGVEVVADPLLVLGMLGMAWVGQRREEFLVSASTADILRCAGVFPRDAPRELQRRVQPDDMIGLHGVSPAVAEVVEVPEALSPAQRLVQGHPLFGHQTAWEVPSGLRSASTAATAYVRCSAACTGRSWPLPGSPAMESGLLRLIDIQEAR